MRVLIAEKPSQAQAYASALGNGKRHDGYIEVGDLGITWAIGHLVELKPPEAYDESFAKWTLDTLPIIPDSFQFQVAAGKQKQFSIVKKLIQSATEIIIGTDIDREGENIARLIIMLAGGENKVIKRLWINSLEASEIRKGMKNLRDGNETYLYFLEAQARQVSDWVVGLNLTRNYTLRLRNAGFNDTFHCGRVQSPTLFMIYEREREIQNFKKEIYFELHANVQHKNGMYVAKLKDKFSKKEDADQVLSELQSHLQNGNIVKVEEKHHRKRPPSFFNLSNLQIALDRKHKINPAQSLKLVQALYDKKLLTYPRTSETYITENEYDYLKAHICDYAAFFQADVHSCIQHEKAFVDSSKVEEHYALLPTRQVADINTLSRDEQIVYLMVVKSVVQAFMSDYEYSTTHIDTQFGAHIFEAKGKTDKALGWKAIDTPDPEEQKDQQSLPVVAQHDSVTGNVKVIEKETKPPERFSEGQLISIMKNCGNKLEDEGMKSVLRETEGLGTEATRSSIIEQLFDREYVVKEKGKVRITEKGSLLCETVEGTLLSKPALTAQWETFLKKIGKGEKSKEAFIEQTKKFVKHIIENTAIDETRVQQAQEKKEAEGHIAICPACKSCHVIAQKTFYGCTGYKSGCSFTIPGTHLGKNITTTHVKDLCEKQKTKVIKGFISKQGKQFDAALTLNNEHKLGLEFAKTASKKSKTTSKKRLKV